MTTRIPINANWALRVPFVSLHSKRTLGVALGLVGALAATALGAVQSAIWNGADAPLFAQWLANALGVAFHDARAFEQPAAVYFAWGRWVWLVYIALLGAQWLAPLPSRWARSTMTALLALAFFGDLLAYGASATFGPALRQLGFLTIEVPALATALLLTSVQGVALWRRGRSRRVAIALILSTPAALLSVAVLRYAPHGLLLPLGLSLALQAAALGTVRAARSQRRGVVVGVLGLFAAGFLALVLPYRPIELTGPEPGPNAWPQPSSVPGMSLHIFNTGMNRMSELLVGARRPWRPAPAFVIEHPSAGLIVFDTGLSDAVAASGEDALPFPMGKLFQSRGLPERTLPKQMRRAGLDPDEVRIVIVSHLHEDHVGGLEHFPAARFVGGPGTLGFAREQGLAERWQALPDSSSSVAPFAFLDDPIDLLGDGSLVLFRSGGHTTEDLMLAVGLPGGTALLAGDTVVHWDWLEQADVERIVEHPLRAAAARNAVRALLHHQPEVLLLPGHDLSKLPSDRPGLITHNPEWFGKSDWPI